MYLEGFPGKIMKKRLGPNSRRRGREGGKSGRKREGEKECGKAGKERREKQCKKTGGKES